MLNIFADALLIAMRMGPYGRRPSGYRPEPEEKARARWFALSGLRR